MRQLTRDNVAAYCALPDAAAMAGSSDKNLEYADPFDFLSLGLMAYVGADSAVQQVCGPCAHAVVVVGCIGS